MPPIFIFPKLPAWDLINWCIRYWDGVHGGGDGDYDEVVDEMG